MVKPFTIKCIALLLSIVLIQGCNLGERKKSGHSDNKPLSSQQASEVSIDLEMGSSFLQRVASDDDASEHSRQTGSHAPYDQNALGHLNVRDLSDNTTQTLEWPISFDSKSFKLRSKQSISLKPGVYDFEFLASLGNHQYVGVSSAINVGDTDKLQVNMLVQAIIGDTNIRVHQVENLPSFKMAFESSLFKLSSPRLGVIVDNADEVIFKLPRGGNSDYPVTKQYLALSEGNHRIQVALYDGNVQVGKSITEQEHIVVVAGEDMPLDIVPLSGQVTLSYDNQASDAHFSLTFPNLVIDEIGWHEDLDVLLKISSTNNTPSDALMGNLVDNGDGTSTVTYVHTGLHAEKMTLTLDFYDSYRKEIIANCIIESITLQKNDSTFICGIQLVRRAVFYGHVLATLGVNVYDESGNPVPGAIIKANGEVVGITGSGHYPAASSGYVQVNIIPDSYSIRADSSNTFGVSPITLSELDVKNLNVILNTDALPEDRRPFITTWKTDNDGVTSDNQIKIGTKGSGYNYRVEWGDGTFDEEVTGDIIHTYDQPGIYTIAISGDFPRIFFDTDYATQTDDSKKLISIEQWGDNTWQSMGNAFRGCEHLISNARDKPNLTNVQDMSDMFAHAEKFNSDIGNWNVSSVKNMSGMFNSASQFNRDIGNWDVSQVTDMTGMFFGAGDFNQDIGRWDVANVTNMAAMFLSAPGFNQDISRWDVSNVTDMAAMFMSATTFNQNIGNWDVSNVENMQQMFWWSETFNQDIGDWNVSNVTNMAGMFYGADTFDQDIGDWNVSNVTNMASMFYGADSFNQNLGHWDVENVHDMQLMFVHVTLSTENYDAMLNYWSTQDVIRGIELDAGDSQYSSSALEAREKLVQVYKWKIKDGGMVNSIRDIAIH